MDFIQNIDSGYLAFGLFIVFLIGYFIVQRRDDLKLTLQYRLICYAIVMVILLFSLPRMPWTATISSHMDLNDTESKEPFLNYLEKSNDTIERIIDIVRLMIFVTVFWFISIISSMIKHFKLQKPTD